MGALGVFWIIPSCCRDRPGSSSGAVLFPWASLSALIKDVPQDGSMAFDGRRL